MVEHSREIPERYISFVKQLSDVKMKVHRSDFISAFNPRRDEIILGSAGPLKFTDETFSTISKSVMVDWMLFLSGVEKGGTLLEIGTGTGYSAALSRELVGEDGRVISIERDEELVNKARKKLDGLGYSNITLIHGDGLKDYPENSSFDAIIVTAACRDIPEKLANQLADGGTMVVPVTLPDSYLRDQDKERIDLSVLIVITKKDNDFTPMVADSVMFVPLVSDHEVGWTLKEVQKWSENIKAEEYVELNESDSFTTIPEIRIK